jgi:tetratricopeptide (TPR) repeat protein
LALGQADYSVARLHYEESLAISRELENNPGVIAALNNLACLELAQADHARATTTLQECLALSREQGHQTAIAGSLSSLGELARLRGDYADARKLWSESLKTFLELGSINSIPNLLDNFAALHAILGEPERGSRLWGAAERLREKTGGSVSPQHRAHREQDIESARDALGDEGAFDAAWQAGREMTMDQAIELALEGWDA